MAETFKKLNKETYCTSCPHRQENNKKYTETEIELFAQGVLRKYFTNKAGFCQLGYTQNPKDEQATANALANGARLCYRNNFR